MIRKLTDSDVDEAAIVWLTSGHDEYSYLPAFQRLDETSALRVFKAQIQDKSDLSVFDDNGILKGFIAIQGSSIDRLYVRPEYQRQGVSSALLQWAKNNAQGELTLFTHQENTRARSFYEKHKFVAVKFGLSPAPELVPDVEYKWYGGT